jgi:hypothetical protein
MVKVKGLPATKEVNGVQESYVYRVSEESWSWSYDKSGAEYQYTVAGQNDNPFTFSNTKKTGIDESVKHSESKVTNIFKAVGQGEKNEVYDDLKARATTTTTNP